MLLDLGRGAYHCLPGAAPLRAPPVLADLPDSVRQALVDAALVVAGPQADEQASRLLKASGRAAPRADLTGHAPASPGLAEGVAFLRHVAAMRGFRHLTLQDLVTRAAAQRRRALRPSASPPAVLAAALTFRALQPWDPQPGLCLYRAWSGLAYLRRRGADATWVFGVRTWPFRAHCWLEADGVVLNDRLDRIAGYTPILAV